MSISRKVFVLVGCVIAASATAAVATVATVGGPSESGSFSASLPARAPAAIADAPQAGTTAPLPAAVASNPFIVSQNVKNTRVTSLPGVYLATAANGDTCIIVAGTTGGFGAGCGPTGDTGGVATLTTGFDVNTGLPLASGGVKVYGAAVQGLTEVTVDGVPTAEINGGVFEVAAKPGSTVTVTGAGRPAATISVARAPMGATAPPMP